MNFILFGPPGIGKSSLIGFLKMHGVHAIDLEDVYPSKVRFSLPNAVDGVVFGAADLNPSRRYSNTKKILLTAKQDIYERRRGQRDARDPAKRHQDPQQTKDWESQSYDLVLDTSNLNLASTAKRITQFINKFRKESKS